MYAPLIYSLLTGVKIIVAWAVPDESVEAQIQLQRQQLITDKVIERLGDEDESNLDKLVGSTVRRIIRIADDDPY